MIERLPIAQPALIGTWGAENVLAAQTGVTMALLGGSAVLGDRSRLPVIRAGCISGIVVRSDEARTAGTLTVEATINGSATGLTAVLDATNTTVKSTMQAIGADTLAAGDELGAIWTTSALWAPITADVTVMIEVMIWPPI